MSTPCPASLSGAFMGSSCGHVETGVYCEKGDQTYQHGDLGQIIFSLCISFFMCKMGQCSHFNNAKTVQFVSS